MDYLNCHESWEWQGEDLYLQKDCDLDISKFVSNGVTQNEEDISYMFDQTTPVKDCGHIPYHFDDFEAPQAKRRRMLDFDNGGEDISSLFLKSKERIDFIDEVQPKVSEWEVFFQEELSTPDFEDMGQSEAWIADFLNDCSNDGNSSSDVQIGSKEVCKIAPDNEPNMVQRTVRSSPNVIFKGRKSYMRPPTKVASSVVYPFDFIKPCGVRGDMTLKDINQRILSPHSSKPNQVKDDQPVCYPTSAFSGKPVVGKTKIPTQGGKGSITIMRTKG